MTQWEIWKGTPAGMEREHWLVLISSPARIARSERINGLVCFTLRGQLLPTDVYLDEAEGFDGPTAVPCDVMFLLFKSHLKDRIGYVSAERQLQIRAKVKDFFRL